MIRRNGLAGVVSGRETARGAVFMLGADALVLPTGVLTLAYLTRRLGPDGYGAFALAVAVVVTVEFSITALVSRATVYFVSAEGDPAPVAAAASRLRLGLDLAAAAVLWLFAPVIAGYLGEPSLAWILRLFAVDVPLYGWARSRRDILVGRARFVQAAAGSVGRWVSRLLLIVVLVEAGLGVRGAVLGSIGASLVEAAIDRTGFRLRTGQAFSVGRIFAFGLPLFLATMATLVLNRLDLFMLKLLGTSTANVGAYAAAQNAALTLAIVGAALAPVVLAHLSRAQTAGDAVAAELTVRNGLRAGLLLLPWVALLSASAGEVAPLLFGPGFAAATAVLALLVFEGWAMVVIALAAVMLAAAGKSRSLLLLSLPLPVLAGAGLGLAIPRWGMIGAATVSVMVSVIGALAVASAATRAWHARPPLASAVRGLAVAGAIAVVAAIWSTPGPMVLLKLVLLSVTAAFLLVLTGAVSPGELRAAFASLLAMPAGEDERE